LGQSAHAVEPDHEQLQQLLSSVARFGEPGCVAAAAYDGGPMQTAAVGLANIATAARLESSSVLNIASVSKQFTAFAVLLLAQRGALSLEDPIVRYLPELSASAKGISIRHLIHHTGGLRDYMELLELRGRQQTDTVTREETLEILARQRSANTAAGVAYEYSNTGYFLLSVIVERVSGKSLASFSAENIFEPLGMSDTRIVDRYPAGISRLARGYSPVADGFKVRESAWEQTGDGQVHSTVKDLLRWSENFASGKVGGKQLVARMLQPGVLSSGERLDYAAGLVLDDFHGLQAIAHRGTMAGYRAYLLRVPAERFSTAVLCNRNDVQPNEYAAAIAQRYLAATLSQRGASNEAIAIPSETLVDISQVSAGWYRDPRTARYLQVLGDGKKTRLLLGGTHLSLRAAAAGRYLIRELGDAQLWLQRSAAVVDIHIKSVPFHGRFVRAGTWHAAPVDQLAGTYWSDESGAAITVLSHDGELAALIAGQREHLQVAAPGELMNPGGRFVLRFPLTNAPSELLYFAHGVHGLRFERRR
jgi:CubicO group peptidase (beta-lactamase class C family)